MDFWSRLIGGTGASPGRTKAINANTPAERLAACKRLCNALQQIWRASVPLSAERAASQTSSYISALNTLLDDESRKAAPYPCLSYIASTQIYIIVSKLALSLEDVQIAIASTRFFHTLINGEADGVLDSKIFARSLIELVRNATTWRHSAVDSSQSGLSEEDEGNLVELLFLIATKIRLDPDILPAWFYPERDEPDDQTSGETKVSFVGATRKNAFPLFYLLISYVHHDGRMGDFARTGLLYLTETATKSKILEQWMIESDLATTMASGLGALYSRLTRRLPYLEESEEMPPILSLSDYVLPSSAAGFTTSDFQHNLDAFLSYLMFWQDTLDHCSSDEVTETLLDHFQVLFLQQLLYPSLLESSDVDGGSTASVITYLYRILTALDHPALIQRILQYLLATPGMSSEKTSPPRRRPRVSLSRRKSMNQLAALAEAREDPSPTLFNLLDLIVMSLKSKNSQTIVATFKLLSVILQRHHLFARTSLFKTRFLHENVPRWTLALLNKQMARLFGFAEEIAKIPTMNESYENVLNDVSQSLESHSCSLQQSDIGIEILAGAQKQAIVVDCVLNKEICELLSTLFINQTMTNLALTESIISLACCKLISLDGWFIPMLPPSDSPGGQAFNVCTIIELLLDQVRQWRSSTPDWDFLVASQRRKLLSDGNNDIENEKPVPGQDDRLPVPSAARDLRGRSLRSEVFGSMDESVSGSPARHTITSHITAASPAPPTPHLRVSDIGSMTTSPALDALHHHLIVPRHLGAFTKHDLGDDAISSGAVTPSDQGQELGDPTASLGHILTNAVILQEFILEIIAVVQVRASLFEEVNFE